MEKNELIAHIKIITEERDELIVKLKSCRDQKKHFDKEKNRYKKYNESLESAINQSGASKFIHNLARKIYMGNTKQVGCEKCNQNGVFNYGTDENCDRCGGSGFVHVGKE
jgi:site-specific DNA-adenine methylase